MVFSMIGMTETRLVPRLFCSRASVSRIPSLSIGRLMRRKERLYLRHFISYGQARINWTNGNEGKSFIGQATRIHDLINSGHFLLERKKILEKRGGFPQL